MTKAKYGRKIIPIPDIGDIANRPSEIQDEEIENAQIVGVPQLSKYKSCLHCKARVEPSDPPLGCCSKDDCEMYQHYDICTMQLLVKLFLVDDEQHSLSAFGQIVLDIAKAKDMDEITEELFFQLSLFMSIKFNNQKIITKFIHSA